MVSLPLVTHVSLPSSIVKTWSPVYRILVMSMDSADVSDVMQAGSQVKRSIEDPQDRELFPWSLGVTADLLVILDTLRCFSRGILGTASQAPGFAYVILPTWSSGPSDQDLSLLACLDWIHQHNQRFTVQAACWRWYLGLQSRLAQP